MTTVIALDWTPTEADHVAAARLIFARSLRRWRPWRGALIVAVVFAGLGTLIAWPDVVSIGGLAIICGLSAWGFVSVLICWGLSYLLLPRRVRRLLNQRRRGLGPWHWEWTADGLRNDDANSHLELEWHDLIAQSCGRTSLLFYLNEAHVLFVSRRALTEAEVQQIERWAIESGVPRW